MGAEPRGAGAGLPQHGIGRCDRPAVRGGRCPRLGQLAVVRHLRLVLGHRAIHPRRKRWHLAGSQAVGERGPDDVLLPRRRARGEARIRPGGTAGTAPHRPCGDGRCRRHGDGRAYLPGVQRRRRRGERLGGGHVHRHRVRARSAGADGSARHAPACSPAHPRGDRRPGGAARDRHGLHGRDRCASAGSRSRPVLPAAGAAIRAGGVARRRPPGSWGSACGSRCTSRASTRCSAGWRSGSRSARIRPRAPTWSA